MSNDTASEAVTAVISEEILTLGMDDRTLITTTLKEPIGVVNCSITGVDSAEVARRIVACWNACLGMSTHSIEMNSGSYYGAQAAELDRLAKRPRKKSMIKPLVALLWFGGGLYFAIAAVGGNAPAAFMALTCGLCAGRAANRSEDA